MGLERIYKTETADWLYSQSSNFWDKAHHMESWGSFNLYYSIHYITSPLKMINRATCKSYYYYESHGHEQQVIVALQKTESRKEADTHPHFSESGRMAPNCILLRVTSKGYLNSWKYNEAHDKCGCSLRNRSQLANNNQPCCRPVIPKLAGFPGSSTYDTVWATAPATPPQSTFT